MWMKNWPSSLPDLKTLIKTRIPSAVHFGCLNELAILILHYAISLHWFHMYPMARLYNFSLLSTVFIVLALSKMQWTTVFTRRYLITMMVLLYYVNLTGMSIELYLMNTLLLRR